MHNHPNTATNTTFRRRAVSGLAGLAVAAGAVAGLLGPASLAQAAPTEAAVTQACNIPSTADDDVLTVLQTVLNERGASEKVRLATFETAWVESHANNLECGDRDSQGVFQQRPSQGWGSVEQVTDVEYATNAFLDVAIPIAEDNPGQTAGWVAQETQRSGHPERYDEAKSIAQDLEARAESLVDGETPPPVDEDWSVLKTGSSGEQVEAAQYLLNAEGADLDVDGKYGSGTTAAVKEFQADNGLDADGVIGPDTWGELTSTVKSGSEGDAVKAAQTVLGVDVDGKFGSGTASAVKDFQSENDLDADGVVGPDTWKALLS
ncbi:peptidoglycan-binding protein [Naumannella halotolerans]|uniref:Peptidoglycan hydrolase-like protein with peptidoglycan-binding domain n=1 Tax=Naumannella halotolerans TaxID=993414 RepID=A0A4R7J1M9_9ACTN|nr:peptidoglycan-binding protein [Naumannella halotolerans]TDT31062.1 peptidoglycan hydrolase-like protein with peptidoglycan-binding domain [Naumannella halotolerans]